MANSVESTLALYDVILNAKLPTLVDANERRKGRKEIAADVRALFKSLGLKGISVTAPRYANAMAIDVTIPFMGYSAHGCTRGFKVRECSYCSAFWRVRDKVQAIVEAAYPDLDDRSNAMIDYFNTAVYYKASNDYPGGY